MRKFLFSFLCFGVVSFGSNAQVFTMEHDTMTANTSGATPPTGENYDNYAITFSNYIVNSATTPINVKWQITDVSFPDTNWFIYTLCDNNTCYFTDNGPIANRDITDADPISVGDKGMFKLQVAVPVEAANGVGIVKARVFNIEQGDTSVYIINKTPTSISSVEVNGKIGIYPNPVGENIMLYTDKSLNVNSTVVYSITGKVMMTINNNGKEVNSVNVGALASGLYITKFYDVNNKLITTKKFSKL